MRRRKTTFINIIILVMSGLLCQVATAQSARSTVNNRLQIQLDAGGYASSGRVTPFWFRANQYGTVPLTTPLGTVQVRLSKEYLLPDTVRNKAHRFGWGFVVNPVMNVGEQNHFVVPEAHVKLHLGAVELWVGRRRELIGLGDSLLSSGFVIGSGNALPIPKIQLATRGYVPLKFLRSFLAINAGFAHGWFLNTYIQESYLHQKYLYLRFGKPKSTLKVHLGLNHQVQWGGHADYLLTSPNAVNGQLPSSFSYYGNVVFALNPKEENNGDYTNFDGLYRIGNHVGGHDFGLELTTPRESMLLYYQHPFEDVSGLLFRNLPDGLFGLRWKRLTHKASAAIEVNHLVLEFLTTLQQSGSTFMVSNSSYQGADNYFNHSQYREGWSYRGQAIGTPFIAPQTEFQPGIRPQAFFPDNRVTMYYLGAAGRVGQSVQWTTRMAYSQHYGTFNFPFAHVLPQWSMQLAAKIPVAASGKTWLQLGLALDRGQVYPETIGASLRLQHTVN